MTVLRVLYKGGVRFDEGYYVSTHLPLVGSIMGATVKHVEVVKLPSAGDGSPASYQMMFSAHFESPGAPDGDAAPPHAGNPC